MKKEYIVKNQTAMNVCVKAHGSSRIISFVKLGLFDCHYSTEDEEIQNSIEEKEYFGSVITWAEDYSKKSKKGKKIEDNVEEINLFNEEKTTAEETAEYDEEESEVKEYSNVTRLAEAIDILQDEYGVEQTLKKKSEVHNIATTLGISFPNL